MVDKGGCKIGKKSDMGGCKEGKKKEKPKPKKFKVKNPDKPIVLKTNPKTGIIEKLEEDAKKNAKDGGNKIDSKKRKFIIKKNMAEVKKKRKFIVKPKKKVKKLVVRNKLPPKKEIVSELQKHTDLTKTEANKLPALELFGMLPVELRKSILTPSDTGTQVGVAPSLSKEQAEDLLSILEGIHDTSGFISYIQGWSFYEGGNFTDRARNFWDKKQEQLENHNIRNDMIDLLEEPKMEAIMKSTRKKYGDMEVGYGSRLDRYFNAKGELDEELLYNMDYAEYYPEDTYDLIYEDGDYNMSTRTRSTTNRLVKNVIEKELKPEQKRFKVFEKEMKKLIK